MIPVGFEITNEKEALHALMIFWVKLPNGEEKIKFKQSIMCFDPHTEEENYKESFEALEEYYLKYPSTEFRKAIDILKEHHKDDI